MIPSSFFTFYAAFLFSFSDSLPLTWAWPKKCLNKSDPVFCILFLSTLFVDCLSQSLHSLFNSPGICQWPSVWFTQRASIFSTPFIYSHFPFSPSFSLLFSPFHCHSHVAQEYTAISVKWWKISCAIVILLAHSESQDLSLLKYILYIMA